MTEITTKSGQKLLLRPARLSDAYYMGIYSAQVYQQAPLDRYLSPFRYEHWADYVRGYQMRAYMRMLDPRFLSVVVEDPVARPGVPVAHMQATRIGNDVHARKLDAQPRATLLAIWRTVMNAWLWTYDKIWGSPSTDKKAVEVFLATNGDYARIYFGGEEWKNRWYTQSVVVSPEYQGQGLGKAIMGVVIDRAKAEGVPITLEASEMGRKLYTSLGFELRGKYATETEEQRKFNDENGGIMAWVPKSDVEEIVLEKAIL